MARTRKATDAVGRPTSKAAQAIYDAKGSAPDNHASDKKIAKRAAKHVSEFITRSEQSRFLLTDKLTVLYGLWNGDSVAEYFPSSRRVHVPEPYKAVEGFVPRIASILIEQPGWFRVVGMDEGGKRNAELIEKLILGQLKRDGFYSKMRDFLRGAAIYGFMPGKCYWKKRRRKIKYNELTKKPSEDETGEDLTLVEGKETEINQDGPTLETTDVYDFFVDLRYQDEQESPGVAWRSEKFEHEVIADKAEYANVDELLSSDPAKPLNTVEGPPGSLGNPGTFQDIRNMSDGITIDLGLDKDTIKVYEFMEFWGLFNPLYEKGKQGEGTEEEYQITLARRKGPDNATSGWVCVKVVKNPWWHCRRPSLVAHFTRRPHAFQSMGLIEPIISLCAELDDSRQMALAARALAAKPVVVANDDAEIYGPNLTLDPGTIIHTRGGVKDSITALFIPDRSDAAWRAEDQIKNDIREVTGIISTYQGSSDSSSETATSTVNRMKEANKRIAEVAKNIANGFLVPYLEMVHSMNQQMLTKERTVELLGEDGLTINIEKISPEDVAGRVGFEITALPEIEIAGLKARMVDAFMDRAIAVEAIKPGTTNLDQLMKMSWIAQFGTANIGKVFPNADAPIRYRSTMDEHYIIGMGHEIDVQEGENYFEHHKGHSEFATTEEFTDWDEDAKRRFFAHLKTTETRLKAEVEQAGARTPMEAQQQQMEMQQGQPGMGGPQQGGMGGKPQGGAPKPAGPGGMPNPMGQKPGMGPATTTGQVRSAAASNAPRTSKE